MSNLNSKQRAKLEQIVKATRETGFAYVDADSKEVKTLVELGLVQLNTEMRDDADNTAARATDAGFAQFDGNQQGSNVENNTNATPTAKPSFAIATITMPEKSPHRGGGGSRPEMYPFSQLEVGQAFFVPGKTKTEFGSSLASANARYSEEIEGQTRELTRGKNKGQIVPATRQLRTFDSRDIADGADFGQPGVSGVGVWRSA